MNMEKSILKRIANVLEEDNLTDDKQFCVTDKLTPDDINIEVDGLGVMTFPVNQQYIQKLINISSKAKFGLRDQTILNENVRNTYEIKSDKLHVTINEESLTRMLRKMRDILGLGENSVLTPHLHNMLIYGPGQFFDKHQDTEKLEGMVASLVVVLPSPHIGGNFVIELGQKKRVFSSENIDQSNAKCIGFYADCIHEIKKIKQGYRIVLTYNLVLKSEEICSINIVNPQLTDAVKDYFDINVGRQLQEVKPKKLVYFLNHSYTKHGLRMGMLKGADRANASALYGVAQELSLFFHLALVDIHQCWDAYSKRFKPKATDKPIVDDIDLSYWLDAKDKKLPFRSCLIYRNEICWTRETKSLEPASKEYEGFTGNEGNTMDFWYRRAAVVLWPESSQIPMNFKLNYDNAIKELSMLTNSLSNQQKVTEIMAKAGKYLYPTNMYEKGKGEFDALANIAIYIKNKDTARSLLHNFRWEILNSDIVKSLAKLQTQYGISWCIDLLNRWKNPEGFCYYKVPLINEIHPFVQTFLCLGGAVSIVELLLDAQYNALIHSDKYMFKTDLQIKKDLPNRIGKVHQILAACATIENIPVLDKAIEHLISNPKLYPDISLAELFFKLQATIPSEYFSNYKLLRSYIIKTIESNLSSRMQDDWSIQVKLRCNCEHCRVATSFLHSKTEVKKTWPIEKSVRVHIANVFKNLDVPVVLAIDKKCSPYKLIMAKKEQVYKDNKKRFDELKFYQQKLQKG